MIVRFYVIFALLLALSSTVVSKTFCEAFRQNRNRISYVLKGENNHISGLNVSDYFFIIDGHYWTARLRAGSKWGKPEMNLISDESKGCPLFSGNYKLVIWLWFPRSEWKEPCATLFDANNWTNLITGCNKKDRFSLSGYTKNSSYLLKGRGLPLQPSVIFPEIVLSPDNTKVQTLVVITQTDIGKPLYVQRFLITYNESGITAEKNFWGKLQLNALKEMRPNFELIGVDSQWHDFTHIYFFRDNSRIRWCVSESRALNKKWCETNSTVLIDCTSGEVTDVTTDRSTHSTPDDREDYEEIVVILIIVIIVVVIIILLAVIVYYCICLRKESNESTSDTTTKTHSSRGQTSK